MLKNTSLFFLILAIVQTCFGQNKVIDSAIFYKVNDLSLEFARLIRKDTDSAEIAAKAILTYSKKYNNLEGIGIGYGSLGTAYSMNGDVGKSIMYFIKSAKAFETAGNQRLAIITNINIAAFLIAEGEYKEALKYATKAHEDELKRAKLNSKSKNLNLNSTYNLLGMIGIETGEPFEKVLNYFEQMEKYSRPRNDTIKIAVAIQNQGDTYLENDKDINIALAKLKQAFKILKSYDPRNQLDIGGNYYLYSKAYLKKGLYNKALKYNDSSAVLFNKLNYSKGLREVYNKRIEILAKLGKYREAFEAYEMYSKYKDSAFQKERSNQIARLRTEFETEQIITQKETAEAKVKLAEAVSKQNKSYFFGSTIIALLIFLTSIFYFKRLKTKKKSELITLELKQTQKRLAIEKQYRDSELKALKAQMNPHFIFNALNSIQDYIVLNQKNLASDYLGKFADLIRNYLHFSNTGFISIQDEIYNLNLYLELEKLRFEDVLEYTFNVEEGVNSDAINIPTMLIQPYIENALKHGLLHKKDNRKLSISISKTSDKIIECIIEDNGIGREKSKEINQKREAQQQHKSFALNATTERLDLLNYGRDKKIGVEFMDLKDNEKAIGTKVILKIPILKK